MKHHHPAQDRAKDAIMKKVSEEAVSEPREMGRDDRRIIFEKLNDVYVGAPNGYASGWSDHKVSADLGVPRAWVESVRSEFFGDVRASEDGAAWLAEYEKVRPQLEAFAGQHQDILRNLASLSSDVARLLKTATEIRRAMGL